MIGRAHHLNDDRLFEAYLADRSGEAFDPRAVEHLSDCDACQSRYDELTGFLETARAEAIDEADEIFTPAELRRQQEQILRRLEHLNRSARVISFPGRLGRPTAGVSWIAPRWMAAAAVAGLFVGGALGGMLIEPGLWRTLPARRAAVTQPIVRPSAPVVLSTQPAAGPALPVNDLLDDDLFLRELEFALERPHTAELQPFDALTPHVQEIGNRVR